MFTIDELARIPLFSALTEKSGSTLPDRFYAFYVHLRWP